MSDLEENFTVNLKPEAEAAAQTEEDTIDLAYRKKVKTAVDEFDPANRTFSVYLDDSETPSSVTYKRLDELAKSPQSSLSKTQEIIKLCRWYANKNDIIGITVESIDNNVNTEVRLSYKSPKRGKVKKTDVESAKLLIDSFNEKIDLPSFIHRAVDTTYLEGNFIAYVRKIGEGETTDYVVDYYPLGTVLISDYEVGGIPYVLVDMTKLKSALNKTYTTTRKRVPLFYKNLEEEIKATYPPEVYDAYKNNENYAKLNVEQSTVIRIDNQNKKYGCSPIFRALYPVMMLEAFDTADRSNAKARAKKIIVQLMNKEIMGPDYTRQTLGEQAYAHKNFLDAFKQSTALVTPPASVKQIGYVEPKVEMTSIETVNYYRMRAMSTLGISFLMDSGAQSLSIANISLEQLMRRINRITQQLEATLKRWYKVVLRDNGLSPELAPDVQIVDSEMLKTSMKIDLVNLLFNKLNCSYETAYDILGLSLEDERIKREAENRDSIGEVFAPRATAYNTGGGGSSGGGTGNGSNGNDGNEGRETEVPDDPKKEAKQEYDKNRHENLKD